MDSNFNIELDKSSRKPLTIFVIIFGSIVFLTIFYLSYNRDDITEKNLLDSERHSRIIDIFRVKEEHNYIYIKFSGGEILNFKYDYKIGDSISKNRGDSIEYIYRGNSIIKNNLLKGKW